MKQLDMKFARATGGHKFTDLDDLTPNDLGAASLVEERKIGEDKMIFLEGCKNLRLVAILPVKSASILLQMKECQDTRF